MLLTLVAVVTGFWLLVNLFDLLGQYFSEKYRETRDSHQLTLNYGYFKWHSTHFNEVFPRLQRIFKPILDVWFALGSFFGCLFMFLSLILLTSVIISEFAYDEPPQVLTPIIPGVNLPYYQLFLYLITVLISAVFHEAGHGLAAVHESVKVNGVGVFCLVIYPAAFVDLCLEGINTLPHRKRLRIYCAGVFHNFVLALAALLFLLLSPFVFSLFYSVSAGIFVLSVDTNSVLHNKVFPNDVIMQLNGCETLSDAAYFKCLQDIIHSPQPGFCVERSYIEEHVGVNATSVRVGGCCMPDSNSDLCFRVAGIEVPYRCMHARIVSEKPQCSSNNDCRSSAACSSPVLREGERIIRISLQDIAPSQDILYLGMGFDLFYILSASNYIPRSGLCIPEVPSFIETFLAMTVSISGALALLNSVPCYYLDGYWMFDSFLDSYCPFMFNKYNYRQLFCKCVYLASTALLVVNLLLAVVKIALLS